MSDSAIASVTTCVITVATMVIGFLTLWVKLKYGVKTAESIETKVDHNTTITTEAKENAQKASEHSEFCDRERGELLKTLADHNNRIGMLEKEMTLVKEGMTGISKDVSSTRHELRGHLQTITSKLDMLQLTARIPSVTVPMSVGPVAKSDEETES